MKSIYPYVTAVLPKLLFLEQFFCEFTSSLSRTNQPAEPIDLKSGGSF